MRAVAFVPLALLGCVATARTPPTAGEAAAGPPPPPRSERTAGQLLAGTPRTGEADAPGPERPGQVWVRGYWHWTGSRWVWAAGRWERARPAWARR